MYVIKIDKGPFTHFPLLINHFDPQMVTEMHRHECLELVIILGGSGVHSTPKGDHPASKGDVLVIQPGMLHAWPEVRNLELVNILFKPNELPLPMLDTYRIPGFNSMLGIRNNFLSEHNIYPHFQLKSEIFDYVRNLADIMLYECRNCNTPGFRCSMLGCLMSMLCHIVRAYTDRLESDNELFASLNKAITYLNEHFSEEFKLDKIVRLAGMSQSSFMRHFQTITGSSPLQYALQLRIAHACCLLQQTTLNITEIGYKCGFNDSSYFTKVFFKIVKATPKDFRKQVYDTVPAPPPFIKIREDL